MLQQKPHSLSTILPQENNFIASRIKQSIKYQNTCPVYPMHFSYKIRVGPVGIRLF